jgi:integrase/recombinase XerD
MDWKKDPSRRSLKLEAWPEADRRAWEAALRDGDVLEPGGLGAHWAPLTRVTTARCYGRWLCWLQRNGILDTVASPADRLTPEILARYISELKTLNASSTAASHIGHLYMAISVMAPAHDSRWIRHAESRLRRAATGKDKRSRLVPSDQLFSYGLDLMAAADTPTSAPTFNRALLFRDGLMVALLAARPLRRRNFVSIEIGRHLVRQGPRYWLHFAAGETKTKQPIDVPLPEALVPQLERYIAVYRPLLCQGAPRMKQERLGGQQPVAALWVSARGTAMSIGAAYYRIVTLTEAKFGRAINPHLFRDAAATSIATEDPEHVYVTRSVLAHSTLRISERYYTDAQSLEATRRYQQRIAELRHQWRSGRRHGAVG